MGTHNGLNSAQQELFHIIIMGVSGCGKTTVAEALAARMGVGVADADSFHLKSNKDKMAAGIALNDHDRLPWLKQLRDWMGREDVAGHHSVMSCSALKRSYRDILRDALGNVVHIQLDVDRDTTLERMTNRKGHFMPPSLLDSQLETLEPLGDDELGFIVDNTRPLDEVLDVMQEKLEDMGALATIWLN